MKRYESWGRYPKAKHAPVVPRFWRCELPYFNILERLYCCLVKDEAMAIVVSKTMLRPRDVVYLPWFWRWIMAIIKIIPEPLFK